MGRLRANIVAHDLLLIGFHGWILAWGSLAGGASPDASLGRRLTLAVFVLTTITIVLVRADVLPAGRFRGTLYRLVLIGSLPTSYFEIAALQRTMQPELFDMQLWAIDRALFGVTPAEWLVRINRVTVIEWFAFFYQSYYVILPGFLLIPAFVERGVRLQEFLFAAAMVGVLGHASYTLVPGAGPYEAIGFSEPIRGGYWWSIVEETVRNEDALDIFPSLHTAMPLAFTLHLFRHRRRVPYRYLWPVLAFFAANIVVATMLLRWHWGIDVVVGIALAAMAHVVSVRVARRERRRGVADDRQLVWEPVFPWQRAPLRSPPAGRASSRFRNRRTSRRSR